MPDIQHSIVIAAPLERVWDAIARPAEFGTWFGAELEGDFSVGATVTGRIVPTTVDDAVAAAQEPHRGAPLALEIVAIEPPSRFAFRWQPVAGSDVRTTVTFRLRETAGGVEVTVTEDGFSALPAADRDRARGDNDGGWDAQTRLLAAYLGR